MIEPGRKFVQGVKKYRYGFNGKEKDNEVSGDGNQYDYGFRIYDPRLGRFLSVDPLTKSYPWYTPYQFAGNKPTVYIDLDGAEEQIPYLQSAAFDCIDGGRIYSDIRYVRGKAGENIGTKLYREKSQLTRIIEGFGGFTVDFQPKPHVAQAINFGKAIGGVVYKSGTSESVDENSSLTVTGDVYIKINSYTEIGGQAFEVLRASSELKNLSDEEIRGVIDKTEYIFSEGNDYSKLFWHVQKVNADGNPVLENKMVLMGGGATAIPFPATTPIIMPPLGGTSSVNTLAGSITASTIAISQEIAATLAPSMLQMAHKKEQSQSSGSTKKGGTKARRHEKGQTHGSLSSKKGNAPNVNKRKGAKNRGGKKN